MERLPFKQVVIIGAGIGGIDMACALKRKLDFHDFVIYDRNAGIGGTWYDNDCTFFSVYFSSHDGYSG